MAKKLSPDSLLELSFVADPQLSTDARYAAAVHTVIKQPEGEDKPPEYVGRIHLYDLKEGGARAFTEGSSTSSSPRFSPDSKQLAFLSKRADDKPQLYVIPLDGGEARKLTGVKAGVSEFVWHPDGKQLAFVSRGDWEDKDAKAGKGRVVDQMTYKGDGVGFLPTEVAQIYLYDLDQDKSKQLSKLASDPHGLVFSPDGETLYFSGSKDAEDADGWRSHLWALPLKGKKAKSLVKNVTMASTPSISPDGKQLAFFAPSEGENFASPTGLWLVASKGGEARLLSGEIEAVPSIGGDSRYGAYPNTPQWSADSQHVFINANHQGRSGLTSIGIETGEHKRMQREDRAVTSFHHAAETFVFTAETPQQPGELFFRKDSKEHQLSEVNKAFVDKYQLAQASEEQTAQAEGGIKLPYWTMGPSKPRKDGALVLQVHGGPHTNYGYGFYLEFQMLAAAGYTVVYGNPRGSSSYGHHFATAMLGDYGSIDADDVMTIAHDARKNHVDKNAPMHLTGGSYGGFMTNWLVGQTDEFTSAVTQRSICNFVSFYGSSDIGYRFCELEQGGNAWNDMAKLWGQSPLKHVSKVRTPTLILHAEEDHRCPIEQAEQWFIALKRIGKAPARLIRFPDEGHELSRSGRPDRRIQRLEAILDWFEEHA